MNELYREAVSAAERALAEDYTLVQDRVERLMSNTVELQSCSDEEHAYLALLLDSIGLHDESIRILRNGADTGSADMDAALQNVEGMLAAVHNQHERARDILRNALSAAI